MVKTHKMTIAGCERELPLCEVDEHLDIAAFIMFGDVEITEKSAAELLKIVPEHDVCISAEAKGIPLCYEMARQGCGKYIIARKGVKVYMPDPISVNVQSITTLSRQTLGEIVGKAAVLAEGDAADRDDIIFLEKLPVFPK